MWIVWVGLYLVIGIVIAYFQIPQAKSTTDDETLVQFKTGVLILLWGVLVPLAIVMSVPEFLIKLHERKNK